MAIIYDISLPISELTPVWPGDPAVAIQRPLDAGPWVSQISLGSHTGTHVDPPAHFIAGGATIDQLPLETLLGPAWVACVPEEKAITAAILTQANIPAGTTRLLLRTRNSEHLSGNLKFDPDFAALAPDAAGWLLAQGIRLVGIDGPSIELFATPGEPVHHALLGAGVVVVEGLALAAVPSGAYQLICLPLKVAGGDGAPARVVLIL